MTMRPALLAVAGILLASCSSMHDDLARSQAAWAATKKSCPTYQYEMGGESWTGSWWSAILGISNDQPALRSYTAGDRSSTDGSQRTIVMWTENGPDVGSHAEGPPAKTMEQLYADCDHDVLTQDPGENDITFRADARGVLQTCAYQPHQCVDDCVGGFGVTNFTCLGQQ